jgi:serine/threonine protein kinase
MVSRWRGRRSDAYRVIRLLGRGGMGEVWLAFDTGTKRTVALKVLPESFAYDKRFIQRFTREAEAAARLNNPHIIPIHNYGEIDGRLFVDMRFVEGRELDQPPTAQTWPNERCAACTNQRARP